MEFKDYYKTLGVDKKANDDAIKKAYRKLAKKYHDARDFLFLGRGLCYPIALEGALKMKEISYIHAEGYPAGELKHGPIALIDGGMPVVFLCVASEHEQTLDRFVATFAKQWEAVRSRQLKRHNLWLHQHRK